MIRDEELKEPATRPVTRSQTAAARLRLHQKKREDRKREEERWQYVRNQESKLKGSKRNIGPASITVITEDGEDVSKGNRKRQRPDSYHWAVQPEPPRKMTKRIPRLAGAGTDPDDEHRREVLRKEWARALKIEHTHLLLDMVDSLVSRNVDRYYLLALQVLLVAFPETNHEVVLDMLPAMMRNALGQTVRRMWEEGKRKVYLDYPAEGDKNERIECWNQRAELYHGIELGIEFLNVGIFEGCQKGPDGLPLDLQQKVESLAHYIIFTDYFAVNMRRAAFVFEITQLPGQEMKFLVFILNEMMQRETKTSRELEESTGVMKNKIKDLEDTLKDLQMFLEDIGTGTKEAISMQNSTDELFDAEVDGDTVAADRVEPASKSPVENKVLDGFRRRINEYKSQIEGWKSAWNTSQQELEVQKSQNSSLATEMEKIQASQDSLTNEKDELQAQYNAVIEERERLKGSAAASNDRLASQGDEMVTMKGQLETVQTELEKEQSKSKKQTQDLVEHTTQITQLQDEASTLRNELGHWHRLYAELFGPGPTPESQEKSERVLKLTKDLKREIESLGEKNSTLQIETAKVQEAEERSAELVIRNAVLEGKVAHLEKQLQVPSTDITMGEKVELQAEYNQNHSLDNAASAAKESSTTTITLRELKKIGEDFHSLNSQLENAGVENAQLRTKSAELKTKADRLEADLQTCTDANAELRAERDKLRFPGLLPTERVDNMQDCGVDSGTQTMQHETVEGNQNPVTGNRKQDEILGKWHKKNYKTIQKASIYIQKQRKQLSQTKELVEELSRRIEEVKKEMESASRTLEARDLELSQNKNSLEEKERQLQAKIASIEKLEAQIRGLEDEIKNEKEKHRLTNDEKDDLNSKCNRLERHAKADAEKQRKSIEDLRETIRQLNIKLEKQAKEYCDEKDELDRKLRGSDEEVKKEIESASRALQARDLELSENKKSLKENERQLQAKIASIEKLEAQIRGLEDEIKNEKEKHRLTNDEKDDLNSKCNRLERHAKADAEKQRKSIEDLRETIRQLNLKLETQAEEYSDEKEEFDRKLRGSEEQARKLQETIKDVDARLAKKDEELESIMAAGDINRQIIDLLDTIKKKESKIQELKEEATRKETEHGSIQNERNTLFERIHELEQNASLSKNEHEKRVKRFEEEIVQLRKQIDEQAQNYIEAKTELSTCRNKYEAQFTKLLAETSSELTQSRKKFDELQKEIQVLNGNLEVKDKELARMGKTLDDTEKRISNSRDVVEKRYSIIENLPVDVATVKSTLDDIQRMISEQQQNAYNEKTNSGSLHPDEDARRDDSKNFTELGNQIRKLERAITEQCAKNDSQIKVGALQDEIMNLQRSGALLQAEINIAQARRNDAEADAVKWIGEYKLLENRMRKAEAQNQFLDAKLKVELEGQESVNRNYEGLRVDSSISALMTQIGENSKALSQFFDQYKGDVDQVKSLHSRLEALRAELREVESRVDICTGVLGSTSVHSLPGLVNLGIRQPDDKVEGKIVKKVSLLIEKALLKIRSLESALAAKESEAELAALQCEMTVQEADRMHPPLWKEVPSSPRAGTPGSEPEISFHTPESINRRIEQCKTGPIKGIDDTQHKHKDSPVNLYPPLPLSADTKSASTQTMNPQPGKGLAIDGTAVAPRTCTHKTHAPEVLVEKIAADVDKSFSDLEQFRLSVLLHQLSAILSIGKTSSVLKPLLSAGYIYPLAKIGKRNLALLNDAIEAESLPAPEPLEVLLHKALGGMKFKRRQVFSGASLQTYVVIFEIFIDLKRTMYNAKHGIHKERAEETMVSEQHRPTNRPLRAAAARDIPVIKVRARLKSGKP